MDGMHAVIVASIDYEALALLVAAIVAAGVWMIVFRLGRIAKYLDEVSAGIQRMSRQ